MREEIDLDGMRVSYMVSVSSRARRLSVTIENGELLRVTLPQTMSDRHIRPFLHSKARWITRHTNELRKNPRYSVPNITTKQELAHAKHFATLFIENALRRYNEVYGFSYGDVRVKRQKSQWGSCSTKGNLNYNYRLVFLPGHLAEYVVVHELCHLKEFNHSLRFWELIEKTIPNARAYDKELQQYHL